MAKQEILSVLTLEKLFFEKIHFDRKGLMKQDSELELEIKVEIGEVEIGEVENQKTSIVSLTINGDKNEEYTFSITVCGFFNIGNTELDKNSLLNQNAVAILMPYLRSQISLLTAQPEMECVVLPPFNIASMLADSK